MVAEDDIPKDAPVVGCDTRVERSLRERIVMMGMTTVIVTKGGLSAMTWTDNSVAMGYRTMTLKTVLAVIVIFPPVTLVKVSDSTPVAVILGSWRTIPAVKVGQFTTTLYSVPM